MYNDADRSNQTRGMLEEDCWRDEKNMKSFGLKQKDAHCTGLEQMQKEKQVQNWLSQLHSCFPG